MDPIRRAWSVIATALLIAAVAACAAPGAPGAPGTPRPTPPGSGSPTSGEEPRGRPLTETASMIDSYLRREYPGHYAGLALDQAGESLVVYRRESADLDAALRRRFADAPVELREAPHAVRDLDALAARISEDVAYWARRGVPITSIAARTDGTAVEVGTRDVAKAAAGLPKRYGTAIPIEIVKANPALPTPSP